MCNRRSADSGFTVLELIVTSGIFLVLLLLAVPQFDEFKGVFDRINAQTALFADLKRAQAETVTQGCRGIFVISATQNSYSFGCDYLSYDEDDPPSHDSIIFQRTLPTDITLLPTAPIIFNSRGQSVDVDGVISNNSIQLVQQHGGTTEVFAEGSLNGTGVFAYN